MNSLQFCRRACVGLATAYSCSGGHAQAAPKAPKAPEAPTSIRVYLSPGSRKKLSEYLERIGQAQYKGEYVVLKKNADSSDIAEYLSSDVLGHRVAFRMKGLTFGDKYISVSILSVFSSKMTSE
jgi:hypothetical protein